MDQPKQSWLDSRVARERRYEIGRDIGELARQVVPDCIVADETPGNSLPLEITFGVEIYKVPPEKYFAIREALRDYKWNLLKNERIFIHVLISPDMPPPKATIVVGQPAFAVAEARARKYGA